MHETFSGVSGKEWLQRREKMTKVPSYVEVMEKVKQDMLRLAGSAPAQAYGS